MQKVDCLQLGGAGAAGVSDMIFVGDPEHVENIGGMFVANNLNQTTRTVHLEK